MATSSFLSSSCAASVFMLGYVGLALWNLYGLMYPLAVANINIHDVDPASLVRPLWNTEAQLAAKVYLSTHPQFNPDFFKAEFPVGMTRRDVGSSEAITDDDNTGRDTVLLWKDYVNQASLSKSFLLTTLDCVKKGTCPPEMGDETMDASLRAARQWLDHQDRAMVEDDGSLLSIIQSAGQGIESTSIILTFYSSLSKRMTSLLAYLGLVQSDIDEKSKQNETKRRALLDRSTVHLPASSPIWSTLQSNSTLYVHVVVVRQQYHLDTPGNIDEASMAMRQASRTHSLLLGQVDLVKFDVPHHIQKPGRILYHDLHWLFHRYILQQDEKLIGRPPWDMQVAKPDYHAAYEMAQSMKATGTGYPYWKPEVAVKYLIDEDSYPLHMAHVSGMELTRVNKGKAHPSGIAHLPALHVDEIGLTSEKYIPINETITSLPLRISFDRSDVHDKHNVHATTATAGGISPARWRLLSHLSKSFESQKQLGFEQSDIDDLRRLIADTNVSLLGITVLASALHLLFEFLTFKNEVSFWSANTDLTGLSVRSLFLDFFGQWIIMLYLIDMDSSLLMVIPSAIGVLIALWKCQRAAGLRFVRLTAETCNAKQSFWNVLPRLVGYELKATRLEASADMSSPSSSSDNAAVRKHGLQLMSIEADRHATFMLGSLLLPLVLAYTIYLLIMEEHVSWYSWLITSASSAVYAFGFVLMTPQLFLNYKLKSVAHLPWRVLVYKSLNTFVDDLFSFIIRMPTMARISCFRDDVVFFVYLYQRFLYPVDASRPV